MCGVGCSVVVLRAFPYLWQYYNEQLVGFIGVFEDFGDVVEAVEVFQAEIAVPVFMELRVCFR